MPKTPTLGQRHLMDRLVILTGHGGSYDKGGYLLDVPADTTVTLWVQADKKSAYDTEGRLLDDDMASLIDRGTLNSALQKFQKMYGKDLPLTYWPGEQIRNLMLLPPRSLAVHAPPDGIVDCEQVQVDKPVLLSRILEDRGAANYHWSACNQEITKYLRWIQGDGLSDGIKVYADLAAGEEESKHWKG